MLQRNVARINAPRNVFANSFNHKTTMSVGRLQPIYLQEILPGDSFDVNCAQVTRLTSSYIRPVMDNLFMDVYFFFVPNRLVYDKWEQIFGENRETAWAQPKPVSAPHTDNSTVFAVNSLTVGDFLGLPLGQLPFGLNMLPYRSFALIYDQWFRNENLIDPMFIKKGDWDPETEVANTRDWSPNNYFGKLPNVAKFHDVFTTALPNTQKSNSPVNVPLSGFVPLTTKADFISSFTEPLRLATNQIGSSVSFVGVGQAGNGIKTVRGQTGATVSPNDMDVNGSNLGVDLSTVGVLTVPDLRYAFQLQRILERSARGGTRYNEYIMSAFGVQTADSRLQRAEYLGGKRMPLSTQQVAQTTRGNSEVDELGTLGAFSLSNGKFGYNKGFTEHGFVIGVACIRQYHTYQQGIEKFWQRKDRFDYYDPALAHISEQPIYKSELYAVGGNDIKADVFGYQEAWYDLRNRMNLVTGQCRSNAVNAEGESTTLDIYHFADLYGSEPYLTQQFIEETPDYVDRTIAVPSESLDQFIVDFSFSQRAIRCLPKYSTPGLIDHY